MSSLPPNYKLWVDRAATVTGPGLHALIIGVSDYTYLPEHGKPRERGRFTLNLSKVNIPCTSAFRVAKWLRDEYWHPSVNLKTIDLLMSPSAIETTPANNPPQGDDDTMRAALAAEAGDVRRADRANVDKAVQAWKARCVDNPQDIALLYVCGHGIQLGSHDSMVLLEDFGEDDDRFLNETIDIGRTCRGMRGDNMPQVQLYFVDACRMTPPQVADYENSGTGVHVSGKATAEARRSAPIYFSAVEQSLARGRIGPGTYFSQALIQCLSRDALEAPDQQSDDEIKRYWHTKVENLLSKLQEAVDGLAGKNKQSVVLGGDTRPAFFSASRTPPTITVELDVEPDKAAMASQAELRNAEDDANVCGPHNCWERPLVIDGVPAGIYFLHLSATGGFNLPPKILVDVSRFPRKKKLSVNAR